MKVVIEAISGDFDRASESMRLSVHEDQTIDQIEEAVDIIIIKYSKKYMELDTIMDKFLK